MKRVEIKTVEVIGEMAMQGDRGNKLLEAVKPHLEKGDKVHLNFNGSAFVMGGIIYQIINYLHKQHKCISAFYPQQEALVVFTCYDNDFHHEQLQERVKYCGEFYRREFYND